MPQQLAELLYPIDKTNLAPIRLLHFLALACWINAVLPTGRWLQQPAPSAVRSLGRHSLEIFCLGVLLAPLVDGVNTLGGDGWWVRCLTSLLACAVLFALSAWLDWIRRCDPGRPPHTILPVSTSSVERVE
jgi:hypothetical protein